MASGTVCVVELRACRCGRSWRFFGDGPGQTADVAGENRVVLGALCQRKHLARHYCQTAKPSGFLARQKAENACAARQVADPVALFGKKPARHHIRALDAGQRSGGGVEPVGDKTPGQNRRIRAEQHIDDEQHRHGQGHHHPDPTERVRDQHRIGQEIDERQCKDENETGRRPERAQTRCLRQVHAAEGEPHHDQNAYHGVVGRQLHDHQSEGNADGHGDDQRQRDEHAGTSVPARGEKHEITGEHRFGHLLAHHEGDDDDDAQRHAQRHAEPALEGAELSDQDSENAVNGTGFRLPAGFICLARRGGQRLSDRHRHLPLPPQSRISPR